VQNSRGLLSCVPAQIHGHFLELCFSVQLLHESFLHRIYSSHHLRHEVQEAVLFGKSFKISLKTNWQCFGMQTYDQLGDDFPHFKALVPVALVLTLICNTTYTTKDHSFGNFKWWFELQWSLSLWLEAMAFIPQIVMLNKIRICENITSHYVAALGMYRFFYILNWIYRYQVDGKYCLT